VLSDVGVRAGFQHQQPLERGVRSVCALPLTTVHRRLGGLAVGSIESDAYSGEEVLFLSLVTNQVALAVDDALNFDASHHAQEALQSSARQFRQIVDNIPGLVSTRSATGAPEFVNHQMLEFFGQSLEQLPDWSSLIHPDDRERVVSLFERELIPMAKALNLGVLAWSPLASGVLTGKYHGEGKADRRRMSNEGMKEFLPNNARRGSSQQ
jgi:PAS domain-containing protein